MDKHLEAVTTYYNTRESKRGYSLLLHGTKHFGYYKKGDSIWQFSRTMRRMEQELAEKLNLPTGSKVLDAGCGVGDVASYLASNCGYQVEGVDILDFNIDEAKKRIESRGLSDLVNVQLMSYEDLDFPAKSFDAIYTMETFVHSSQPQKVLRDFYRLLKPGGKIVLFEYAHEDFRQMSERAKKVISFINRYSAMPAFQEFTYGVQRKMMEESGFVDIKVTNISKYIMPMLKAFNILAYVPYAIITILGKRSQYVNMMSAVELYRYRNYIRYNIYTAEKPI